MYVYGKNVIKELIHSKKKIQKCFLVNNFQERELIHSLQEKKVPITYLKKYEMDKKVNGVHQGIIAQIEDYHYYNLDSVFHEDLVVVLDHLEDPHNLGAIIRTCEAAGVKSIILPNNRNVEVTGTVMKTSAGTLDRVHLVKVSNIVQALETLKKENFWIVGTAMDGVCYDTLDYQMKVVLVIGNEGSGISPLVKKTCDYIVSIPMKGTVNSLNASVAAGIMIYGIVMKRGL